MVFPCNLRVIGVLSLLGAACGSKSSVNVPPSQTADSGVPTSTGPAYSDVNPGPTPPPPGPTSPGQTTSSDATSPTTPTTTPPASSTTDSSSPNSLPTEPTPGPLSLNAAPLVFTPTASAFSVSVVLLTGDPAGLRARCRKAG